MTRAVVFAYHNVGVRCLNVLLKQGITIPLVVTHSDSQNENIWFESVADLAAEQGIPVAIPHDVNDLQFRQQVREISPDFIFSFYYRQMLAPDILDCAKRGAYNMHGSLLPKYRGRAPVNWAVICGETETGASLHRMLAKPDAGDIVAQERVPILLDDTALEVFHKVTFAAECALDRVLPDLIAGTAPHVPQDLAQGAYFGGRKPEDGCIRWTMSASEIHNLVRGVAPPYPGAFIDLNKGLNAGNHNHNCIRILKTVHIRNKYHSAPGLFEENGKLYLAGSDGAVLQALVFEKG